MACSVNGCATYADGEVLQLNKNATNANSAYCMYGTKADLAVSRNCPSNVTVKNIDVYGNTCPSAIPPNKTMPCTFNNIKNISGTDTSCSVTGCAQTCSVDGSNKVTCSDSNYKDGQVLSLNKVAMDGNPGYCMYGTEQPIMLS